MLDRLGVHRGLLALGAAEVTLSLERAKGFFPIQNQGCALKPKLPAGRCGGDVACIIA